MSEGVEWVRRDIKATITRLDAARSKARRDSESQWRQGEISNRDGDSSQADWHFRQAEVLNQQAHEYERRIEALKAQLNAMKDIKFGSYDDWIPPGSPSPLDKLPTHAEQIQQDKDRYDEAVRDADRRNREAIKRADRRTDWIIDLIMTVIRFFGWDKR